jgi:hypothetical protein
LVQPRKIQVQEKKEQIFASLKQAISAQQQACQPVT